MKILIVAFILAITFTVYGSGHEPVSQNADWTPAVQEFDGVPMVLVPAGCFMMGSTAEEVEAAYAIFVAQFGEDDDVRAIFEAEMPQQEICFEEAFWFDMYPVRQGDFDRLGGQKSNAHWFLGPERPVEIIHWFDARNFCVLRGGRLPTEAEWEYAARGPDGLIYPWGNEWRPDYVVWNRSQEEGTAPVGSIPEAASWVGALDMLGNVWEWTASIYDSSKYPYPYDAEDGRNVMYDNGSLLNVTDSVRVLRGGAWSSQNEAGFHAAYRVGSRPQSRYQSLGFRCMMPG